MLQGHNIFGQPIYSYVKIIGHNLKRMFAKMQAGGVFEAAQFGEAWSAPHDSIAAHVDAPQVFSLH